MREGTHTPGPTMGGSWSVRVYEEGSAHPVGDYFGDLAKVLSFPDAKNTTFAINGRIFSTFGKRLESAKLDWEEKSTVADAI